MYLMIWCFIYAGIQVPHLIDVHSAPVTTRAILKVRKTLADAARAAIRVTITQELAAIKDFRLFKNRIIDRAIVMRTIISAGKNFQNSDLYVFDRSNTLQVVLEYFPQRLKYSEIFLNFRKN